MVWNFLDTCRFGVKLEKVCITEVSTGGHTGVGYSRLQTLEVDSEMTSYRLQTGSRHSAAQGWTRARPGTRPVAGRNKLKFTFILGVAEV